MSKETFAASVGSLNILHVPNSMRQYINEKSEGRGFGLESYEVRRETDPNRVVVNLVIGPHGAEQLDAFQVTLVFGDDAARQLIQALQEVLPTGKSA